MPNGFGASFNMRKLIFVSGWATPRDSLSGILKELSNNFDILTLLPEDLLKPVQETTSSSRSIFASNLHNIIKKSSHPCFLMGWSMGGIITLETAGLCPEKILGLILVSTSPTFCCREDFPHGFPQANVRALSMALRRDAHTALTGFYRKVCHPHPVMNNREETWLEKVLEGNLSHLHQGLDYLMNTDLRSTAPKLEIPTLIIHGRQDAIIPWQAGAWLAEKLPHSEFEVFERDGHDLAVRRPSWLIEKLGSLKEVHA